MGTQRMLCREKCLSRAEMLQHEYREPMMTLQGEEEAVEMQTLASFSLLTPDL